MNEKGVTLIELMVVMAIVSLAMASLVGTFITQRSSATRQSSIQQVQQTGQLVLTMLKRDIMAAGYGTNNEVAIYIEDGGTNAGPDKLFVNDTSFLSPEDLLNDKYGHATVSQTGAAIRVNELDLDSDGVDEFVGGQWQTVISDDNNQKRSRITTITGNVLTLTDTVAAGFLAPAIYYCVDVDGTDADCATGGAFPTLRRSQNGSNGRQALADDIIDLQIAFQDAVGNWYGTTATPTPPSNFIYSSIRSVRITVVARSASNRDGAGPTVQAENGPTWGGADNFIYRMYTMNIALRNLL